MKSILLKYLAKKLDGKKTIIGMAGKFLAGLLIWLLGFLGLIGYMFPGLEFIVFLQDNVSDFDINNVQANLTLLSVGFYAVSSAFKDVGLTHKIKKMDVQKEV